jgi:hypothetical protein
MDSVTKYHQPLFNNAEKFFYRLAVRRRKRDVFYRYYELLRLRRRDITPYRDRHRGGRCFVIGGGPSLKKLDPEPLKNEPTFGVNAVFLIFDWLGFQPRYYCVEDWLVYEDRFEEIKRCVRESECFFPIQFSNQQFDRPNHHYYRALYEFQAHPGWPNFSLDPSKLVWIGGTVTYVCLQFAYYMGFKNVYLIGMDHNYTKPHDIKVEGNEWTSQSDDPNHFHPDYFGRGYRWHDPNLGRMERAYQKARQVFSANGRRIYNATVGGNLEVFERIDYESLF